MFADIHGDLNIRLNAELNGKIVYGFSTMEDLDILISDLGFSPQTDESDK